MERPSYSSSADGENDADIKAAIEASLREANAPKPSAPTPRPEDQSYSYDYARSSSTPTPTQPPLPKLPNYELDPLESDAILTFNQTVEQLQVQGGRDMSRYPGVSELYDKANGLRPKLALGLDDTGRKESESTLSPVLMPFINFDKASLLICTRNCHKRSNFMIKYSRSS
jgi:growth factor-regulated tyrosine kinase substrate